MGRKRKAMGWRTRVLGVAVLAVIAAVAWSWWSLRHWTPDAALWPDQGAELSAADGLVRMDTLKALGARFVYLDATDGETGRDPAFAPNLAKAREAGLQVGAVHRFDPCTMADGQSAAFVVTVPRAGDLLPPAIALDRTAEDCPKPVSEAAVESELMTLINQVEAHAGKPAILKPSQAFEDRYHLAGRIERNLWVEGTWREPTYAGRPWLMWTANEAFASDAADEPLRWVVVRP
ncbi:glycoside hydrolase family 25 protein [Tsuneonella amylolytica]|uniref:glycoside hydrolase family 25 protein n=1 Tax=Tsuneonella amylolytica TaxID=2338327 RepID=UPI001F3301B4|nr:glycoside hydrolase family 25 protein [Tsuneonella amylolytica]